jgi:hypothetical protein
LNILNIKNKSKNALFFFIPTPHASSNSFNLKSSEAVAPKNERAASNWAVVLICKEETV